MALTHHSLQVIKPPTSLTIQGTRILPVQPGVLCRTALPTHSKLPTPASLSGQQKHPHGQHWKTPNPTPHQGTLPKTVKRTPARSARGSPSLSLSISMFCCPLLLSQETSQTSRTGDCRAHLEILGSLIRMTSFARAEHS